MSAGSYQRASSNNSSTSNGGEPPTGATAVSGGSVRLAGDNTKDRMYEPKHNQKAMRVLTVVAYIFFVSLAAIMLSLYYLFIYNPPKPQPSDLTNQGFAAGANGNPYSAPIIINITDCKRVVALAVVNRTQPTPVLETPRVLSALARPPPTSSSTEHARALFAPASDNETAFGVAYNSTGFGYSGGDIGKTVDNDNMDYYT